MPHYHRHINYNHNDRSSYNCDGEYREYFKTHNLVANSNHHAKHHDPYLIDPWTTVIISHSDMWACNKGTALLTNYNLDGTVISTPVQIPNVGSNPALPTGLLINESTGFVISKGSNSASSYLIVACENGTICGYNPLVDPVNAITKVDNSGAVYKGIAMIDNYLCAANFYNKSIDVFDFNFNPSSALPFTDLDVLNPIPNDYGPFNIVTIDDHVYVLYAKQQGPENIHDQPGKGHGYVSVFNRKGLFIKRLISNGKLNSPYGLVKLPSTFGLLSGLLLIANHGNGKLHVYDCDGHYITTLKDKYKEKLTIYGVHGLTKFDNDSHYVYYSAGSTRHNEGVIGHIQKIKI